MNTLQGALDRENFGRARELLDRHRPKAGEADLRGWEWRHFWQLTRDDVQSSLTTPVENFVHELSVSADGHWAAAIQWGESRGKVLLFDLRAAATKMLTLQEQPAFVYLHAAFSPREPLLAIAALGQEDNRGQV